MSNLEQAAWDVLELCERIIDGKRIWSLSDMREVSAPLRAALEQAEPVAEPVVSVTWSEVVRQQAAFCDRHCTWLDHASDCPIGNPNY